MKEYKNKSKKWVEKRKNRLKGMKGSRKSINYEQIEEGKADLQMKEEKMTTEEIHLLEKYE
jgi:hypothetical protein